MASFLHAYDSVILAEGGYRNVDVPGDRGGQTYAGISRVMNPDWPGWSAIDAGQLPPTQAVRDFYHAGWWTPIQGDDIRDQRVATAIFLFSVNTSAYGKPMTGIKVAQLAARCAPDGYFGPKTLDAINAMDPELFLARFTLAAIARHVEICNRDRTRVQAKTNLLGWMNRDLEAFHL